MLEVSHLKSTAAETMSSDPEITEAEATNKNPTAVDDNATETTTTSNNGQTSNQDKASKQDLTDTGNYTPNQDSSNDNPQDGSAKQEEIANPNQDSTMAMAIAVADPQIEPPKQDSTNANPQNGIPEQNTSDPNSKRGSTCLPLPGLFAAKGLKSQFKNPAGVQEITYSKDELAKSIDAEIKYIKDEAQKLNNYTSQIDSEVNEALNRLKLLKEDEDQDFHSLRDLQKAVTKLKLQIPKQKADVEDKDAHKDHQAGTLKLKKRDIPDEVMKQMPQLYNDNVFVNSPEFKDLEARFNQLPIELKLCLLCFSIFPGNEDINKRLMVYWWMTEGFVPPIPRDEESRKQIKDGKKTAEEFADEFFEKLTEMGFIQPVKKKRSLRVGSYRMHPFISTALVMLAEKDKFFDFENGKPTQRFSETFQACLVGKGLIDYQDLREGKVKVQDLEKLHAVINFNEHILEFKKEWLLQMKNVNILYLGRWKASATHHIEVEDEEEKEKDFLDALQNMNHLKFFSLQGVSRIMELPESISKLSNLMILDLRACHSLESIPEKIGSLKNLTHLDISECYLLESMPKGIASLSELRVLKGFVVSEKDKHSCNLRDLVKLRKLIKLSIYTGLIEFPEENDIEALQEFKVLRKLTIAWGGAALKGPSSRSTLGATRQAQEGKKMQENTPEKQGVNASQAKCSEVPDPPKPEGMKRKENTREIQGGDASKPQSSTTAEVPKPDEGEREKEKTREKQGASASLAQSSRIFEPSQAEGEKRKETSKEIQEESASQSTKSTTEAPKPDDGAEKQEMTTKEIQEQAPSSKSISGEASETGSWEQKKTRTTVKDLKGRDAPPSSKSTTEAPKQADSGKREKEKTPEQATTALHRQRTFSRSLTFNKSHLPPPLPRLEQLEKLDLKSFPKATTPEWLMPSTLKSLKKLYIRGGKFSDLGQYQDLDWGTGGQVKHKWKVEILRLKYLRELEMDWKELQELFPNLVYLEKFSCPKLSFFPCDGYGVWINQINLKQMQEKS